MNSAEFCQGERIVVRIFLCHARDDKSHVCEVYHRLWAIEGFEPWLDQGNCIMIPLNLRR
jgi:hypothetical protein